MVTLNAELVADLSAAIGAAALDPNRWQDFLEAVHGAMGGVSVHAFGYDTMAKTSLPLRFAGYDPQLIASYLDYFATMNPWIPGFFAAGTGRPVTTDEMIRRDQIRRTEFYDGWIRPQENALAGGGVILFQESSRMFVVGGNIPERYGDQLESRWLRLLELLTPQLRQAFEINRALAGASLEAFAASRTGDAGNTAVILLGCDGHILYANPLARGMLEVGRVIRADMRGRIAIGDHECAAAIGRAVRAIRQGTGNASVSFVLSGAGNAPRYICRTIELRPELVAKSLTGLLLREHERCLLLTLTPAVEKPSVTSALMQRHHLTLAEAEVALDLAGGSTPREVAEVRARSVHTVRAQIKAAMSKMGVRRQADMLLAVERLRREL